MFQYHLQSKRYQPIIVPHSQYRFNSVKASQSYLHPNQTHLTKRHSLDSRPQNHGQKHLSYVQNIEDFHLGSKHLNSKQIICKPPRSPFDDNAHVKYFIRGKNGKSSKKYEKSRVKKVKRTWSELGKQFSKKQKPKYDSISKYEQLSKANVSDRLETKHQVTNGKSNQSSKIKRQPYSGDRMKMAKSLLNSTMLTKRQSEQPKNKSQNQYYELIIKLKDILEKYEKKMKQLKDQKQYYKQRLRKQKRKKLDL